MRFSLAISPCPNDTFIFDHLIHHHQEYQFDLFMEDVEQLNKWAFEGRYDITKVSFASYLRLKDTYTLLDAGAALGYGVGPLLVSAKDIVYTGWDALSAIVSESNIAIPGKDTTANLLLASAFPGAKNKKEMIFSDIEQSVLAGETDMGLLIHEGRFTYKDKGLHLIKDMGEWWEETHALPIPLGCIVIKNEWVEKYKDALEHSIRDSINSSWGAYPQLSSFVKDHAQEMSEEVMKSHIELYVNDESIRLSEKAWQAIRHLDQVV